MTFRRESFRLELLDANHETVGELHPQHGAEVTVQSGATVGRTLTGLVLDGADVDLFDPLTHRLRPWMTVDGVSHSLGVFVPTISARHRTRLGDVLDVQGHDQGYRLAQTLDAAFGVDKGDTITDALNDLAVLAGVVSTDIVETDTTLGTWLAWPPGSRVADAMAALCRLDGRTTPWFDAAGTMRIGHLPYVGADRPAKVWEQGTASEIGDDAVEVDDQWNRATEWCVIGKSADANLAGRYRLPDSHPLSEAARGYRVVRTIDVPGVSTTAQCRDRARDAAQRDSRVHRSIDLSVQPDPALEQHDICTYRDRDYLLASFTIPLSVGAASRVTLRESLIEGEGA